MFNSNQVFLCCFSCFIKRIVSATVAAVRVSKMLIVNDHHETEKTLSTLSVKPKLTKRKKKMKMKMSKSLVSETWFSCEKRISETKTKKNSLNSKRREKKLHQWNVIKQKKNRKKHLSPFSSFLSFTFYNLFICVFVTLILNLL